MSESFHNKSILGVGKEGEREVGKQDYLKEVLDVVRLSVEGSPGMTMIRYAYFMKWSSEEASATLFVRDIKS